MTINKMKEQELFKDFLAEFVNTLKNVFYKRDNLETFIQKRGFPALVLREIMAKKPLSVAIPSKYGGRGAIVSECLGMVEAASYESLPLSLTMGINFALFLQPVLKYGDESIKQNIVDRFLYQQNMGGLMITEPDFGSDAFGMQTSNKKLESHYRIQGTKHWQGLTGLADYWLITSRNKDDSGNLGRDIDFFVCDVQQENQHIVVEEYYNNAGLYPIPYGKNIIDILVPEQYKLKPHSTGIKLMMDLLHRSRYHFPGMAMGFIHRNLDEAILHCSSRIVGGKPLIDLDQVQHQIACIQSAFTLSSAMCARSSVHAGLENDLSGDGIEASSMKAYVTDLMQETAQILTQLKGANGYKQESLGIRGINDSRPFQIFEGANDMLYTQIAEMVLKLMKRSKITNLAEFLKSYSLTAKVADHYKSILNFTLSSNIAQRKIVDLGKIIARTVCANHVIELGINGFRQDLIRNCIETVKHEIAMLTASFNFTTKVKPITEYTDSSNWQSYLGQ